MEIRISWAHIAAWRIGGGPAFRLGSEELMANSVTLLAGDQALAIAQADAGRVYRDLSPYRIQLVLEDDGWHVDYELKDPELKGGGPHYLIDAQTGTIVSKRYEQ